MNYLNCKWGKGQKKIKKSVTKRRKFSTIKTPIPSEYWPTCFV